jgi:hypothetical protein
MIGRDDAGKIIVAGAVLIQCLRTCRQNQDDGPVVSRQEISGGDAAIGSRKKILRRRNGKNTAIVKVSNEESRSRRERSILMYRTLLKSDMEGQSSIAIALQNIAKPSKLLILDDT